MGYRIETTETVEQALHRVTREQIDLALGEIDDGDLDRHEVVHQVRKRCKKVRALARLVRKSFSGDSELGYSEVNAAFRDASRKVSDLRDAKVRVDTLDRLVAEHGEALDESALAPVRAALVAEREDALRRHIEDEGLLQEIRRDLESIREGTGGWRLASSSFDAVAGGFAKTYRRARKRMTEAYDDPTPERFHEWRKRVKYHRYQVRLLRPLWPTVTNAWRHSLHDLTDLLGDGNDLTELQSADDALGAAGRQVRDVLEALLERRRRELWDEARDPGKMHFEDPAEQVVTRLGAVWSAARN